MPTLSIFLIFFGSLALAESTNEGLKPQLMGHGKYGFAGCGFGSMVFEPQQYSLFAMTLNHITSSQAFGISTGTSNCYQPLPTAVNQAESLPLFIEKNKNQISADAARGNGETLKTLSQLIQCKPEEVAAVLKENYKKIFVDSKMQPAAIEANINNFLSDDQKCF